VLRTKAQRLRESLDDDGIGGVLRGAGRVAARGARRLIGR
jgi:hypothetical protein